MQQSIAATKAGATAENAPAVLVLLAAHNGARWICRQIESILAQRDVEVTLVVSDDGSTDGTLAEVAKFRPDRRVRVLSPPAATGSAAQNFLWLIRDSGAEPHDFVALSDQDDIWHEDKLFRGCAELGRRGADGYSCAVTAFWSDGRRALLTQRERLTVSDFLFEGAGQGCTYVLTATFYRRLREFLKSHAQLTANLHFHDWAIYALSRVWGLAWVFDRSPMMDYRQHAANDTGARSGVAGIGRRLRLMKSGWYAGQLRSIARLCHAAAPDDPRVATWLEMLGQPAGLRRRIRLALFCLQGGRRRAMDEAALVGALILGWV